MNKRILSGTELDKCKRGLHGCRECLDAARKLLVVMLEEESVAGKQAALHRVANAVSLALRHQEGVRRYIGDPATRNGPEKLR